MTKDDAESGQYVLDVTRSLAEMPYRDKATDLQSVVKAKYVTT
jgi:propanediol dehydratase large subunit